MKKSIQTTTLIAAITAEVDADCEIGIKSLALAHGTSVGTMFFILRKDLELTKKTSREVPKV